MERSPGFMESLRIFLSPNAAAHASELFRESFGGDFPVPRAEAGLSIPTPPENWRQYVAIYRWPDGQEETVGFCNWIKHGDVYLEGGMCVRKNFYRRLPRDHFRDCQARGGIAQLMMEQAATELTDCTAWFGYCGDAKAMAVDRRVGFEPTEFSNLIVKWFRPLPEAEGRALIKAIADVGPF